MKILLTLLFVFKISTIAALSQTEESLNPGLDIEYGLLTKSNDALVDMLRDAEALHDDHTIEVASPCVEDAIEAVLSDNTFVLEDQLVEIKESVYEEDVIMNADVTYSFLDAHVADAEIKLYTHNNEVDYISMEGIYDVLGMSGTVGYGFSIDQIMDGATLDFYADFNSEPILKIKPGSDFNAKEGGRIDFQFWNGRKYEGLKGYLAKNENDKFQLYIYDIKKENEVDYLKVNVRGLTPGSMKIKEFEVDQVNG